MNPSRCTKHGSDNFGKLLIEIKSAVELASSQAKTGLEEYRQSSFLDCYDAVLADAERDIRGSPKVNTKQLSAPSLHKRLVKNKAEILRFMFDFAVPFDNNGSERDLRMLQLQQKIAGCFRTTEGVTTFCRMRSYLLSARKQGQGLLTAIEHALNGKPIALAYKTVSQSYPQSLQRIVITCFIL